MPLGGLIALAIFLPNILMLILPAQEVPPPAGKKSTLIRGMEVLERIGQAGVFAIPFFYHLPLLRQASVDALAVMVLALGFYYSGWVRYATKGHRFVLLYAPFLGIPLPMAISPVIYFLAAAIFLHSWPLVVASIVLGIGHISISQAEWNRCRSSNDFTLSTQRRT